MISVGRYHGFFLPLATSIALVVFTLSTIHGSSLLPPAYSSYEVIIPKQLAAREGKTKKDELSYIIKAAGRDYIIRLNPPKPLLAKNLPVFTYNSKGERVESHPYMPVECYRQGHVEGIVGSLAVLRTCLGLTGLLKIGARIYGIEPLQNSSAFEHLLYLSEELQPILSSYRAGVGRTKHQAKDLRTRQTTATYNFLQFEDFPKYIELYVVVDKNVFAQEANNVSKVQTVVLDVVNIADATFEGLKTHIVLVGLEIWTENNLIDISTDIRKVLKNFNQWRITSTANRTAYDTAFLFLQQTFEDTLGQSYHSAICEPNFSAGLQVYLQNQLSRFARGFSHELASHIGMNHDDAYCVCGKHTSCIMHTYYPSVDLFSNCSILDFIDLSEQGLLGCLLNVPQIPSRFENCGNGVLDVGEQCDCGGKNTCVHDPCCTLDCRLTKNARCGTGKCCRKCMFIPKGEICRAKANECDLPEYCNGKSAHCPKDLYLQDGTPCSKYTSYCYKKRCWNHDFLCRRIFKGQSRSAHERCYLGLNILGTPYGNCGIHPSRKGYLKCNPLHSMCGKVQCVNVESLPNVRDMVIHKNEVQGKVCWSASHLTEIHHHDIGSVPNGIMCDPYKVCINRKCVSKAVLNSSCDPRQTCRGRGVCNNLHKCHCNSGWAPPNCKFWGAGGSIDGGFPVIAWGSSLAKYILGTIIPFCMLIVAAVLLIFPKVWELGGSFLRWWKTHRKVSSLFR
ncbi:disintegrin and metalloproteinase domain-containing protein 21-like [Ahaetulla prasina]|uniref:disintegrin and metalloproteinase domain-containing protein 21-like n=1 Tax=Ahaetulla prasina TaxID=499056 RepID=UPI002647B2C1|nr:disintegrin and metalloproteinase domain-containing protein 21-like [Ahaetulla prasina]